MNKMVERLRRRALRENRIDDANDSVIRRRLDTYERDTRPVLDFYSPDKVVRIDATQSQIRVLNRILEVLVPLKEHLDATVQKQDPILPAPSAVSPAPSLVPPALSVVPPAPK
jgi:adenylate kinase